jgi:oligopeptide transport system permease protein
LIAQGLPVSLTLGLAALIVALARGRAARELGGAAARQRHRPWDHGACGARRRPAELRHGAAAGAHLWPGLRWLPVAGWQDGNPYYLVLPVITLALPLIAYIARLIRSSLLEVLQSDFIRAARARGLGSAASSGAMRCRRRCCRS